MFLYRRKYVFCLFCALLLGAVAVFHQFVFLPQREALAEKEQQTVDMEHQIRATKAFLAQREDLASWGKELAARRARNERLLPRAMGTSAFFGDLEVWAAQSQVRVTGVKPQEIVADGGLFRQRMEVSLEGDYFQILDFLFLLEQGRRFVAVERLSGDVGEAGTFACRAGLSIYASKGP